MLAAYRTPAPVLSSGRKQYRFITAKMATRLDAERPGWRDGLVDVHVRTPRIAAAMDWDECHEAVTRAGEEQPCNKPAVALRRDPQEGNPYPVCGHHARANDPHMLTLADLRTALDDGDVPVCARCWYRHQPGAGGGCNA